MLTQGSAGTESGIGPVRARPRADREAGRGGAAHQPAPDARARPQVPGRARARRAR